MSPAIAYVLVLTLCGWTHPPGPRQFTTRAACEKARALLPPKDAECIQVAVPR